jgi:hypothetical protein
MAATRGCQRALSGRGGGWPGVALITRHLPVTGQIRPLMATKTQPIYAQRCPRVARPWGLRDTSAENHGETISCPTGAWVCDTGARRMRRRHAWLWPRLMQTYGNSNSPGRRTRIRNRDGPILMESTMVAAARWRSPMVPAAVKSPSSALVPAARLPGWASWALSGDLLHGAEPPPSSRRVSSNPRSASRTLGAPPSAISSLGQLPTPAVGACGSVAVAGVRNGGLWAGK